MAIDNTIIDAGPVSSRKQNRTVVVRATNVIPPAPYLIKNPDDIGGIEVPQTPERVGQMVTYRPSTGSAYASTMYVVVDIDGTLTWKPVQTNVVFKDAITGKDWDPNAQFYATGYPQR